MLFGEMISVALQSIRANLFRGFLTMLGIIIGVGAVIAGRRSVRSSFEIA